VLLTSAPATVHPARNAPVHLVNEDSQKRRLNVPTRVFAVHLLNYHPVSSIIARVNQGIRHHLAIHAHPSSIDHPFQPRILANLTHHVHSAHLIGQFRQLRLVVLRRLAEN